MSISAAMIIKRGECKELRRCLASIRGLVNEIVAVVDPTPVKGDVTDELLFEYKAKEIFLPWPGDYAAARNESLKHITSDWVLIIDTDEYIKAFDFNEKAAEMDAPIHLAEEENEVVEFQFNKNGHINYQTKTYGKIEGELGGYCQTKNTNTILCAVNQLREKGFRIADEDVKEGFAHVCELTGLMGRWQTLRTEPTVVCDTGHNLGGFQWITRQLRQVKAPLHIVFGMVNDKDISGVLSLMPHDATYYFCQASVKRALPHAEIKQKAATFGLSGESYPTVREAYEAALAHARKEDFVYVGGSSFVVADLLTDYPEYTTPKP